MATLNWYKCLTHRRLSAQADKRCVRENFCDAGEMPATSSILNPQWLHGHAAGLPAVNR
jgi:hypothetical protein